MRQADRKLIRKLPLFREMKVANFEKLLAAAYVQHFPRHMRLISEGDVPDFLHIVIDGSVKMSCVHNEREATLDIMGPATTFVLAAVLRDAPYLQSARTLTPAHILVIPSKMARTMFYRDAGFARATVKELADRYRSVVRSLKNEKLRTSLERLANWILLIDGQQGHRKVIKFPLDKRTLASKLGTTPANLSRNLSLLARYGVKRSGQFISIVDRDALTQFAKPNALIDC